MRIGIERRFTSAWFLCLACPLAAHADIVTLNPDRDNTLYESSNGATSNGQGTAMFAGVTGSGAKRRAVMHFDVSAIPAGSTINAVTLTLNVSRAGPADGVFSAHRLLADWGEGTTVASGNQGAGGPTTPLSATWIHRFAPGPGVAAVLWNNAGGDFDPAASASLSVGGNGSYSWTGAGLVQNVQAWLDGSAGNFGWLMKGDETVTGAARRFDTREAAADVRPQLTIEFTLVPAPGAAGLMGLAGMVAMRRRRGTRATGRVCGKN